MVKVCQDLAKSLQELIDSNLGDMNRPIYRHLAEKKWKAYRKLLLDQRIDQLSIVPDMLPKMEVIADIKLRFASRNVHPGDFVDSRVSEQGPHLAVQVFDKGERLVTVAVVDPDVPDVQRDGFNYRCHYLAVNVPLSPTSSAIHIADPEARFEVALPWLPPMVQKGDKYHRLVVFILQQPESARLDSKKIVGSNTSRTNFKLRSLIDKASLKPISAYVFRSNWDEGTDGVMERAGVEGADLEYRRRRIESLVKVQLPIKKKVNRPGLPTKRLSLPTRPFRRRMKS
jgi:large subunit ribosomal protein L35